MDKLTEEVLLDYVINQHLDKHTQSELVIEEFCSKQPSLTATVYRGHDDLNVIRPALWYSSSFDINVALDEFSGDNCCVFIIHLLEIPSININYFIGDKIGDKKDEQELIFLGGGKFYKDKKLSEEGYVEIDGYRKRTFECWYSIHNGKEENTTFENTHTHAEPDVDKVQRVLDIISEEEYDFITSVDDIVTDIELNANEKQEVFNEIQKRKTMGGRKKIKTSKLKKKSRKRITKRRRKTTKRYRKRKLKTRRKKY